MSIAGLDIGLEGVGIYVRGLLLDVASREFLLSNPAPTLLLDLDG